MLLGFDIACPRSFRTSARASSSISSKAHNGFFVVVVEFSELCSSLKGREKDLDPNEWGQAVSWSPALQCAAWDGWTRPCVVRWETWHGSPPASRSQEEPYPSLIAMFLSLCATQPAQDTQMTLGNRPPATSAWLSLRPRCSSALKDLRLTAGSLEQGTELQWEECRACRWRDPESSFPKSLYLCTAWARLHQPRPTQLLQDFDVSLAGSSST